MDKNGYVFFQKILSIFHDRMDVFRSTSSAVPVRFVTEQTAGLTKDWVFLPCMIDHVFYKLTVKRAFQLCLSTWR